MHPIPKKARIKETLLKKIVPALLVSFLLTFMLLIFGPAEIFFANVTEFGFVYGEFAGHFAAAALVGTIFMTAVLAVLPDKLHRILLSILFGMDVASYLQVMFMNKHLDLLGENPEGYQLETGRAVGNLLIWILVIALVTVLAFWKKEIWRKTVTGLSVFLLCIQLTALVSLLVTADRDAFEYPAVEGQWHLSGENQYTVSANKNVIVIILDCFSNLFLDPLETAYPGATDFLHDFTYYSNADCNYYGTYPSLPHMLTGIELDMSCGVNEWCEQIWNNEQTERFYDTLRDNNYVVNLYTPDTNILCGANDVAILQDKFSNVVNAAQDLDILYKLLFKTMGKMSAYRMFPNIVKPYFYTNMGEYSHIVTAKDNPIQHENFDFYQKLLEKGLTTDEKSDYYIVQHLMGPHLFTTDAQGHYKEISTLEDTTRGCMLVVEEYLIRLKELGVYDDATIILTADHGQAANSQVIFYMKEPGETHEASPVTDAPISHNEFFPTIAEALGMDYTVYGQSVHNFSAGESRERTVWVRNYDNSFPAVMCYTGDKYGHENSYFGYTYTGDIYDLLDQVEAGPSVVVPMVDSYF